MNFSLDFRPFLVVAGCLFLITVFKMIVDPLPTLFLNESQVISLFNDNKILCSAQSGAPDFRIFWHHFLLNVCVPALREESSELTIQSGNIPQLLSLLVRDLSRHAMEI